MLSGKIAIGEGSGNGDGTLEEGVDDFDVGEARVLAGRIPVVVREAH